ncbi:UDP-N-acetylmuramoyl-L-alanyl-D-glutamate--2,6-diaminopimelate ligase [Zafaria sp. Z1313]|uniref:UDP-N-acetylmuramoyl-L-alanyl-D-glutamate--2, 6-diaminopimelate ligase n=1 Tax=Zafaria sp. Z1313 TaxID=3423202 RepID=UPI003D3018C1
MSGILDPREAERAFRPREPRPSTLAEVLERCAARGLELGLDGDPGTPVTGVCLDSRAVLPGDVYVAVPGANRHGADFCAQAAEAGAVAALTDDDGASRARDAGLAVLLAPSVRDAVGTLASAVFGTGEGGPALYGVTGTNGKTTTSYFIRSLLNRLGSETGLIGTIEIAVGPTRVPSVLTTPEAPQLHALMARMREAGIERAAMEVSSHAIDYRRTAGLGFEVAGFTNLTQDHLDLHGAMEDYFLTKARLFEPGRSRHAVVVVDDDWGRRLAEERRAAGAGHTWTLATAADAPDAADWTVRGVRPYGLGHAFELHGPGGAVLRARTGLPGLFNVANAALAVLMVHASGIDAPRLQGILDDGDPLTVEVPGRMQLVGTRPNAIVDFAHNADALERAITAVRGPGPDARVVVVFGATGQRDVGKRPVMGAVAARHADVVIVTDDDPHDEEPAGIRRAVLDGALSAIAAEGLASTAFESHPRADAIREAVRLARPQDTILVAGRGHEAWQEVKGVNLALDDREELRAALAEAGRGAADGPAGGDGDSTRGPAAE